MRPNHQLVPRKDDGSRHKDASRQLVSKPHAREKTTMKENTERPQLAPFEETSLLQVQSYQQVIGEHRHKHAGIRYRHKLVFDAFLLDSKLNVSPIFLKMASEDRQIGWGGKNVSQKDQQILVLEWQKAMISCLNQ